MTFHDMATLVTEQGELLGQIEFQVQKVAAYADKGNDELLALSKLQRNESACAYSSHHACGWPHGGKFFKNNYLSI